MKLRLTGPEVEFLASKGAGLPPMISNVVWTDDAVHADVDLRAIPSESRALRLAASIASVIGIDVTFAGFDPVAQLASFTLSARTRAMPAHRLLSLLTGPVNSALTTALTAQGLPEGLVTVHPGSTNPRVTVAAGQAIRHFAQGTPLAHARLSSLELAGGAFELEADLL